MNGFYIIQRLSLWTILCLIALIINIAEISAAPRLGVVSGTSPSTFRKNRTQEKTLDIQKDVLADLISGRLETFSLPVNEMEMVFEKKTVKIHRNTTTWIGKSIQYDADIILTAGRDHFFAKVYCPDGVITYQPEASPSKVRSFRYDTAYAVPLADDYKVYGTESKVSAMRKETAYRSEMDDGRRIDVMILYTTGFAEAYPGTMLDPRLQYLVDLANTAFSNSNVDTELRLVYRAEVDYPDDSPSTNPDSYGDDLNVAYRDLMDNTGVFSDVEALRTLYGADQVVLLRRFIDEGCGQSTLITAFHPDEAYAVVHDGDKPDGSGQYCTDLTYAHEVGHNLGCAHNRENAGVLGRFDYSFGYRLPERDFRTVMALSCGSTSCERRPYFSNPDVAYMGAATGIPEGENEAADNAKTINYTKSEVAAFRKTTMCTLGLADAVAGLNLISGKDVGDYPVECLDVEKDGDKDMADIIQIFQITAKLRTNN